MGRGASKIWLPEDGKVERQLSFFEHEGVRREALDPYPPTYFGNQYVEQVIDGAGKKLGLDFEFNPKNLRLSITGVATQNKAAAAKYDAGQVERLVKYCMSTDKQLVGHSVLGAERDLIEENLHIKTPVEMWDDSMVSHYLLNQDLCKAPGKTEDEGESGALGFMNLWTTASMALTVPNWKDCRGSACEGPCPKHSVFDYCATDAWASLASHDVHMKQMQQWNMPHSFYRETMELSEICHEMQKNGVRVDLDYVREMDEKSEQLKASLFPLDENGEFPYFNPRSADQVLEWFRRQHITLKSNEKSEIQKVLEKTAAKYGYDWKELDGEDELPISLEMLHRTYQYKKAGKGYAPWFAEKYIGRDGLFHPRFIVCATSTGRLASAKPNFQNIPARGFGALIRAAVRARMMGGHLVKADFSQLELRIVLYLAGVDPAIIGKDAFTWLVSQSNGMFEQAAALYSGKPRDIAKSVSHGGDYLEGITIVSGTDLEKPNIKKDIAAGALRVYAKKFMPGLKRDWEYGGGIVAFTGANLAERLFGDRSRENRAKANTIQEDIYFKNFPMIREWHMKTLEQIEAKGYVQSPTGSFLRLYGRPLDNAKMGVAFHGQGTGALHVQGVMLRFKREQQRIPMLQVHDELVFEVDPSMTDKQAHEFIQMMGEETWRLPGFKCPYKAIRGTCWLEGEAPDPKRGRAGNLHIPGVLMPLNLE